MEASSEPLLWITLVVMLVGLAGSVLPGLPGVPLIFLSALVYAFLTDFEYVGGLVTGLLGLFAAIALVADFAATTYGARRFGASNWGTAGGGIFLGEYLRRRRGDPAADGTQPVGRFGREDWQRTSRAAGGVLIGYVASAVAQGFLGLLSVVVFILALFG